MRIGAFVRIGFVGQLLAVTSLFSQTNPNPQDRIAELEARVRRLEALVERLTAAAPPPAPLVESLLANSSAEAPPPAPLNSTSPNPAAPNPSVLPQELLPGLGKIGAAVSLYAGPQSGAYSLGQATFLGGGVELPLRLLPGGRLSYEISAGLAQGRQTASVTSNVAQVANLAVLNTLQPNGGLANVSAALGGTGAAPFPVTVNAQWNLRLLQVSPFTLKYTATAWDRLRLRPYLLGGPALFVTITNAEAPLGFRNDATLPADVKAQLSSLFANQSPFGGQLIGGQITAAKESVQRNLPNGQGGMDLGYQAGGGLNYRLSPLLSLGLEYRYARVANRTGLHLLTPRLAWHW